MEDLNNEIPEKQEENKKVDLRVPDERGRLVWPKGVSGNPNGRPKGKTLKEFVREMLMLMSDEEKKNYLKKIPPEIVWRMAEGNPHNTEDVTSNGDKLESLVIYLPKKDEGMETS